MTAAPGGGVNPYVGPRSFRTGETLYGREREAAELLDLLIAERIVLLYSPSGAGKTSLIQAALIPRLQEEEFRVLPVMRVNLEPSPAGGSGEEPVNRYVYSALLSLEEGLPEEQRVPGDALPGMSLIDYLEQRPRAADAPESEVLIFDQFEEVLTLDPTDPAEKEAFFEQVRAALRDRHRWALFAMREDYVASLDPYARRLPTRLSTTFRLDLLGIPAARQAIQRPARQAGVDFDIMAAHRLIDDLRRTKVQRLDGATEEQLGPYVEPVQLQVVCYRLWERLPDGTRTIEEQHLAGLGDVDSALAEYYAEQVRDTAVETGVRERGIREWFDQHLITQAGIRGQVLQEPEQSKGLENRAIRRLENVHLVRGEKRRGATWFELAHDRLIQPVRANNAGWFQDNLSALQKRAAAWDSQSRPDGLLLLGRELADARRWAADHAEELLPVETDFLAAAGARERRSRLVRAGVICIAVLAVVASLAAVSSYLQYLETREQKHRTIEAIAQVTDGMHDTLKELDSPVIAALLGSQRGNYNLLQDMGNDRITQRARAVLLQQIGDLERRRGRLQAAQRACEEALKIGLKLASVQQPALKDQANLPRYYDGLGAVQKDLAKYYARRGDARKAHDYRSRARDSYETSLALERQLAGRRDGEPVRAVAEHSARLLPARYLNVGDRRSDLGDIRGAREAYEKSRTIARGRVKEERDPIARAKARYDLMVAYERLGKIHHLQGDWREMLACSSEYVDLATRLARDNDDPEAQVECVRAYRDLAYAELLNRHPRRAIAAAVQGRRFGPEEPRLEIYQAHGYLFDGQLSRALELYGWIRMNSVEPEQPLTQWVLDDFKVFRKAGLTHPDMGKIEKEMVRPAPGG